MQLLEYFRNKIFWIIDKKMGGGRVKKALDNLNRIENTSMSEEEIESYQRKQIRLLLQHAMNTVPFYSGQTSCNVADWPVVNKNVLRENGDRVLSIKFDKKNLYRMSTSGSTGTPFVSLQDIDKKRHVNAETLYYNGKIGYKIGRRIIYLRSVVSEVSKSHLQQFAQNIYLVDCNDLSDTGIKAKLKLISEYSHGCGAMLLGYASTFTAFQKYFDRYGYDDVRNAEIYGVVSGSEMLYDVTRISMEKAFGCKCVSRYANEENGFLGQDDDENNQFYVNRADYYVEILKMDEDVPVDENKVGRIVVTDLFNYAMPMIRYDTGDVGAIVHKKIHGLNKLVINSFGGRVVDTVENYDGNLVSPIAVTNLMWKYIQVRQFQLIQKRIGYYKLILNADRNTVDEKKLLEDYRAIFGKQSLFEIEYVSDIPVLASGKRRYIVNESR